MKWHIVLFTVLMLVSVSMAADFSARVSIRTGNSDFDLSLNSINDRAKTPDGAKMVRADLMRDLSLTQKEMDFLSRRGYTLAEIYYLASLARACGKHVDSVAALHGRGVGWGVLAHRLGVRPDALRKWIVKEKKAEKAVIKARPMEQKGTFMFRSRPHGQPSHGAGKGRGR